MLQAQQLECVKGYNVLFDGLSFDVEPGQIVQITGANGSGKTSLLRILTGLSLPESGEVLWQGEPVESDRNRFNAELAYFGHLNGIKAELTALENVQSHCAFLESTQEFTPEQALEKVGLRGYEEVYGYQLSAGQKRRVGLSRLYLSTAKLWILDEPATAIDVDGVAEFEALLVSHAKNGGMIILTSHQQLNFEGTDFRTVSLS